MGPGINGLSMQIYTEGAQNGTKSGRADGVTKIQERKSTPECGDSIDGPVYAVESPLQELRAADAPSEAQPEGSVEGKNTYLRSAHGPQNEGVASPARAGVRCAPFRQSVNCLTPMWDAEETSRYTNLWKTPSCGDMIFSLKWVALDIGTDCLCAPG